VCKEMRGQAYSKYSQGIGPQGGFTLSGDALKAEAKEEMEKLDTEILNFIDNGTPLGIVIG